MSAALLALVLLALPPVDSGTAAPEDKLQPPGPEGPSGPQNKPGKAVVAESASEGARDLAAAAAALKRFVTEQPYGKTWRELAKTEPAPKDDRSLGGNPSMPALSKDKIEMQEQVQYLESTGEGARYGYVSIAGVRVFRYGKLNGVRLVLERIGKSAESLPKLEEDVRGLAAEWKDIGPALELGDTFVVKRNDLTGVTAAAFKLPLRVEIEKKKPTKAKEKK